ncbi:MAG TPA: helix-turn-helix domain-containing protein [Solirubrobacteraceae bacterium]|nr:helix-turn-helix domain-containing protein [Solirubrobacteraceae bacterium]
MNDELPVVKPDSGAAWRRQRETASRNEAAIAAAAAELFRRHGVANVEVRDIAAAAGVGIGTIYRRFGDKAAVIAVAIGEQERALQDALLSGPPPLGPGAPPAQRLDAFLRALCELTERNLDVVIASEGSSPGARYRVGAYGAWRLHVEVLLKAIDEGLDAEWLSELLLAPLAAELYRRQRHDRGMSAQRIADNVVAAAMALTKR